MNIYDDNGNIPGPGPSGSHSVDPFGYNINMNTVYGGGLFIENGRVSYDPTPRTTHQNETSERDAEVAPKLASLIELTLEAARTNDICHTGAGEYVDFLVENWDTFLSVEQIEDETLTWLKETNYVTDAEIINSLLKKAGFRQLTVKYYINIELETTDDVAANIEKKIRELAPNAKLDVYND